MIGQADPNTITYFHSSMNLHVKLIIFIIKFEIVGPRFKSSMIVIVIKDSLDSVVTSQQIVLYKYIKDLSFFIQYCWYELYFVGCDN